MNSTIVSCDGKKYLININQISFAALIEQGIVIHFIGGRVLELFGLSNKEALWIILQGR